MKSYEVNDRVFARQIRNIDLLSEADIKEVLKGLTPVVLKRWMSYFIGSEQYEICAMIKAMLDQKASHI